MPEWKGSLLKNALLMAALLQEKKTVKSLEVNETAPGPPVEAIRFYSGGTSIRHPADRPIPLIAPVRN